MLCPVVNTLWNNYRTDILFQVQSCKLLRNFLRKLLDITTVYAMKKRK
jgi:hypothetical protein